MFVNTTTPISIEFPTAPLSVGDTLIQNTTEVTVAGRRIPILLVEDVVKDRLAAFIHWRDYQSLIQAVAIILKHHLTSIMFQDFCLHEGETSLYQLLEQLLLSAQQYGTTTMTELETRLTRILLDNL